MRTKYIYLLALLVSFGLFSCEMRNELTGTSGGGPTGKVALHLLLQQETSKSTDESLNMNDFYIRILDMNRNLVREIASYNLIADAGGYLELPAGDYIVHSASYSGGMKEISLGKPYYAGETSFSVKANQQTEVETTCERQSAKIELTLGDDFLNAVTSNYAITLTNNQGVLTLNKDNYGVIYLKPSSALNVVVRATTTEGKEVYKSFNITNEEGLLKPSDELNITFGAEEATPPVKPIPDPDPNPDNPDNPDPDNPDPGEPGESYGTIKITINVTLNGRDEDVIITYPDDPGETPTPSPGEKPVITGTGTQSYTKATASEAKVEVSISTSNGIQNLFITIDSPLLTPEVLAGVSLPSEFDLASPGNLEGDLKDLGLIGETPIKGSKTTSFDISKFVGMMADLSEGPGTHNFHVSVTDVDGKTTSDTLTIIFTD